MLLLLLTMEKMGHDLTSRELYERVYVFFWGGDQPEVRSEAEKGSSFLLGRVCARKGGRECV